MKPATRPMVSVVIPCRNEGASLARALDSVLASDYPRDCIEIIVADGSSSDGSSSGSSRDIASRYAGVQVIDNPARFTPAALNLAIAAARGDYILRVDAHSEIGRDYVARTVEYLEAHPDVWSAGGRMRTETEGGVFARAVRVALSHRFGVGNSGFRTTTGAISASRSEPFQVDALFNACWRREVFAKIGGFDERLTRSQDIDFSQRIRRAGGRLVLLPSIESVYYTRGAFAAFARQSWTNGVWALLPALHLKRIPLSARHLAPLAFVVSLAMAALFSPLLALAIALPYAILNLAASTAAAWRERDASLAVLAPVAFATLHLGYGAGSVWGALRVLAGFLRRTT